MVIIFITALPMNATGRPRSLQFLDGYYDNDPNASVTMVKGKSLKDYSLEEYRGLTLVYTPEECEKIEEAVKADSNTATDKETSYRKGKLYYAFLTLPKSKEGNNRYLFYLNQTLAKGDKIILIYMEGKAPPEKIKKLIKK